MTEKTLDWDVLKYKPGHIQFDWQEDGIRCLVIRGSFNWCAYLGVPIDHPLCGHGYDDVPLDCHGGLTFAGPEERKGGSWPEGWWFFGWDYGHCDDASSFDHDGSMPSRLHERNSKKWTADEVKNEIEEVLYEFKKLVRLSEKIVAKKPA